MMTVFNLIKEDELAIITMNDQSQSQNVLNKAIQAEFNEVLTDIENDPDIKGVILTSDKPNCFMAGADITVLQAVTELQQARELSMMLQTITKRIAQLEAITVVAIDGVCLGGGLELAMAFDYRVVSDNPKTKLGLPEVQLGLLPGGSGTQRLPMLVPLPTALDLMLTGKQLDAKRALKASLVDDVVSPAVLLDVAKKRAKQGKRKASVSLKDQLMFDNPLARKVIFSQARKKTLAATKGHYPAPMKILDVVEYGLTHGLEKGLLKEAEQFAELVMTPQAKQLIKLFFATTELKKDSGVDSDVQAQTVDKVGVLGAGLMGAGIAYVSLTKASKEVRLKDISPEGLARGIAYVGKLLDKKVSRRFIKPLSRQQQMSRLTGAIDYSGFRQTDVVIEAVFEDLSLKQKMVADIEAINADKDIIFATNTSAIPIDDVAAKAKYPERIVGMHYFSPVEKMPLLEVVTGSKTSDVVTATAVALGKQQGKTVIVVNDGPGFYTTRILVPYVMEAVRMVIEGVAIEDIDAALETFGFPVGPIKLMDEVGIDVGAHIVTNLHAAFGARIPMIDELDKVIEDDRKGKKNGRGFYSYDGDPKAKQKPVDETVYQTLGISVPKSKQLSAQEISERCVLTMVNEAAFCYGENILRSARDGDIGAIFGLGFPPFLGGPFAYADQLGIDQLVSKLESLQQQFGERFTIAPALLNLQKTQKTFY